MATTVYDTIEIELENGDILNVKPLPIKKLRKFMDIVNKAGADEAESEDQLIDVFIEACTLCIQSLDTLKYGKITVDEVEDLVTLPTVMKILEIAGGLKTSDPNLMGAALVGMN